MWTSHTLRALIIRTEPTIAKVSERLIASYSSQNSKKSTNKDARNLDTKESKTQNKENPSNFIRISSLNSRGGAYRKFRVAPNEQLNDENDADFSQLKKKGISDLVDPEELDERQRDLELYSVSEQAYHSQVIDEDMRARRRAKIAIIKKKIKKLENPNEEVNLNLLTWDAKEQIKHLNSIDPETWTPDRIAESFPITVENCRQLLKSKWAPQTLEQLARHDDQVIENWKILAQEHPDIEGGPSINIYREFIKSNKVNLMKHAAGIPGMEFERKALVQALENAHNNTLIYKPGIFSKIILNKPPKNAKIPLLEDQSEIGVSHIDNGYHVKNHLSKTQEELSRCFAKIFQENEINLPKFHQQQKSMNLKNLEKNLKDLNS